METERRRYSYRYVIETRFTPAVEYHFFKLRAVPCECSFQHLQQTSLRICPDCSWKVSTDGYGNAVQYGGFSSLHDFFTVECEGIVECQRYEIPDDSPADYYLFPTRLTEWKRKMCPVEPCMPEDIMHWVHCHIEYQRFATTTSTTAQEAFVLGKGVCQDYAHLMIAVCRSAGLKARYVNGLLLGEGETHAWVEVHDGHCWRGYDPTHDRIIDWGYVKIAHGRDADDCPCNRGRIYAWTSEMLTVTANLKEME